eukprot:6044059-Prymnesium_polylepis.1
MTAQQIENWKTNVPALNRVTPDFKKVASLSAKTPWSDLTESDGDPTTYQLIMMKEAFDQE